MAVFLGFFSAYFLVLLQLRLLASDVVEFPRDTVQPAVITITVGRNLHSPQFLGARPYFSVIEGTANTGREILTVSATDADTDVSLYYTVLLYYSITACCYPYIGLLFQPKNLIFV